MAGPRSCRCSATGSAAPIGADVDFAIEGRGEPVTVFTTRPDTLYGATFFVVAADAPLAAEICAAGRTARRLQDYLAQVRKLTEIERQATDRREDRRLPRAATRSTR